MSRDRSKNTRPYGVTILRRLSEGLLYSLDQGVCLSHRLMTPQEAEIADRVLVPQDLATVCDTRFYGEEPYRVIGYGRVYQITARGKNVLGRLDDKKQKRAAENKREPITTDPNKHTDDPQYSKDGWYWDQVEAQR